MSFTTGNRVTPVRRGPIPPPAIDPRRPSAWVTGAPVAATVPDRGIQAERRRLETLRRLSHSVALSEIELGARGALASDVDISDLPDPATVFARRDARRARQARRDAATTRILASGNPRDLTASSPLADVALADSYVRQLNDAYAAGRIPHREWKDRVTNRIIQLRDRSRTRAANGRR